MCGICGNVTFSSLNANEAARFRVKAMLHSLSHRGPDAVGQVETDLAVFGATRLAIRGLDEDVNQPMVDADSGVIAVCNGEIDNHGELRQWLEERGRPVRRSTDVAVIPGLYLELGEAFATQLVGAFAIAIWDARNRRLTLARDRAGERPLFFAGRKGEVIFATEIAALAARNRLLVSLDQRALRKYLQFGIFPAPDTPFGEVRKVGPGELIQFDTGGVHHKSYWRWQNTDATKQSPSLETFDRTFRTAVGRQTEVDVDFGIFLSGGIDSSLVAAVTRSLHPERPLKAYTLRFEESSFDEGNFARKVAKRFNLDLATVWVQPHEVCEGLKSLVRLVGEPLADPAWIPAALLARRAAQDVKMCLVGEGADELFGGYPTYIGSSFAERYNGWPGWIKSSIRRVVEKLPPSEKKVTLSYLLKRFVQGADLNGMGRHRFWASNIPPALLRRLGVAPMDLENRDPGAGLLLDRVQRWDLETPLAEGLLTKADRASMSSALELRAPFLDKGVMEFAKSLPVEDRVRGFQTKIFLKQYALRYLPRDIVHRRKRGLSVPIAAWLRGPLRDWAAATLGAGHLQRVGIENNAALDLFTEHCERKADYARALWTLLVLSEWLQWVASETDTISGEPAKPSPKSNPPGPRPTAT